MGLASNCSGRRPRFRNCDAHEDLKVDRELHLPGEFVVRIYVGNLSFQATEESLREAFAQHGEVEEVAIITDRDTGRSRGFAFVTMSDDEQAQACH